VVVDVCVRGRKNQRWKGNSVEKNFSKVPSVSGLVSKGDTIRLGINWKEILSNE